jgi:hypothetical protein
MADYTEGLPFAGKPSDWVAWLHAGLSQAKDSRFAFAELVHCYVTVLNRESRKDALPSAWKRVSRAIEER